MQSRADLGVHVAAAFECPPKCYLIGVFKITTNWQAPREPADAYTHRQQQAAEVGGGRLPFQIWVRRQDHLGYCAVRQPQAELADLEISRPNPIDGTDRSAQDVIATTELTGAFHRDHVLRFLDHANSGLVTTRVAADPALGVLGHVEADLAELHSLFDQSEYVRQPPYIIRIGSQDV